jgi:hypothetical protein
MAFRGSCKRLHLIEFDYLCTSEQAVEFKWKSGCSVTMQVFDRNICPWNSTRETREFKAHINQADSLGMVMIAFM